jgi:hypothetical protein
MRLVVASRTVPYLESFYRIDRKHDLNVFQQTGALCALTDLMEQSFPLLYVKG